VPPLHHGTPARPRVAACGGKNPPNSRCLQAAGQAGARHPPGRHLPPAL